MIINRNFKDFKFRHRSKKNQIIYTSKKVKNDDEVLNLIDNFLIEKNSFIFESVEKGKIKGRYTIFGKNPDKIWEFNNNNSYLIKDKKKIKLISSGGTFKTIKSMKFRCIEVSEYTGFSEILDGRVKTLHPKIHAGILNKRKNKFHKNELKNNNFENIDLVIVNFYPFEKTLEITNNKNKIIENIDIGGPAMVRAAAKNFNDVTVITSTKQYPELINQLEKNNGTTSLQFREKMSREAFSETAYYDSVISNYLNFSSNTHFPEKKVIHGNLIEKLRYGENPHQESALYSKNKNLKINQIHGKQLSYNNYNDIFSALTISKSLPKNTGTVILKHANPCGVSILNNKIDCFKSALACDPVSAFGGIVSCNFKINKTLAIELNKIFFEVIVANGFEKDAIKILKSKKNLRILNYIWLANFKLIKLNSYCLYLIICIL